MDTSKAKLKLLKSKHSEVIASDSSLLQTFNGLIRDLKQVESDNEC